jgi:hypothetical protein
MNQAILRLRGNRCLSVSGSISGKKTESISRGRSTAILSFKILKNRKVGSNSNIPTNVNLNGIYLCGCQSQGTLV